MDPLLAGDRSVDDDAGDDRVAGEDHQDKQSMNRLAERINTNRIAIVDFVLTRIYARTKRDYQSELGRFANLPPNKAEASIVELSPCREVA
jgi:hypothetical protein